MASIIEVAIAAAQNAGTYLQEQFGKQHETHSKDVFELVTACDKESERIIINTIKAAFPEHHILAEESGNSGLASVYIWIIDPIDGTHNFIRHTVDFGVSIGIVYKNEYVAGVIYMPCTNDLYSAEQGSGAFKNNTAIAVSLNSNLLRATIAYDSSLHHAAGRMVRTLDRLSGKIFNLRIYGSSVRNLTYLAEGAVDAVIEFDDKPWDSAAGICINREAGAQITTTRGKPFAFGDKDYVASNGSIHAQLLPLISD